MCLNASNVDKREARVCEDQIKIFKDLYDKLSAIVYWIVITVCNKSLTFLNVLVVQLASSYLYTI